MPPTEQQDPAKPNDAADQAPPPEGEPVTDENPTANRSETDGKPTAEAEIDAGDADHAVESLNEAEQHGTEDLAAVKARLEEELKLTAEAKPITLRDFNGKICLEGEWPFVASIASIMLTQEFTLVEGKRLTLTLENARAVYELVCSTADGRTRIYQLTEDHANPEPAPETPEDPADAATNAEPLRTDGPTLEEWVRAGYAEDTYPPKGYAKREASDDVEIPASKPRSTQGVVAEPSPGQNPNVKCPECKMFGNRHRPTCSLGGPG